MATADRLSFAVELDWQSIAERVRAALAEDLAEAGDITTAAVFPDSATGRAAVTAKAEGVLCGGRVFALVFEQLGGVEVEALLPDGAAARRGDVCFRLRGRTRSLLAGERTALNFIQRLSGIATRTRRLVDAAGGTIAICDTRKTMPLWRDLDKYAVACGGGTNHRIGLYDMVMLKDTHADGAGGIREALALVKPLQPRVPIAAEARNLDEVREILAAGVDLIMLDNMDDATLREAVALIDRRVPVEVTGGIDEEKLRRLAGLGIDRVSVGGLTHSVTALDLSMTLQIDQ